MGCWNATCNVSNLPIFWGDKVVLIPLVKVSAKHTQFNTCYPTDNFLPLGFPIFGEYDDYGRIENARTSALNEQHLRQFKYYFEERDDNAETSYKPVALKDTLDGFVGQVLCCHEGCYIDIPNPWFYPDGKAMVTYVMMHQGVYETLLSEMSNRIPYDMDVCYHDAMVEKLQTAFNEISGQWSGASSGNANVDAALESISRKEICEKVFGYANLFHQYFIWGDLACIMQESAEARAELFSHIATMKIWTQTLSHLRKGYLCDSGAGSQSGEMRLHLLLAQCIRDEVARIRQSHEWDEGDDAETIYLW